jgi:DNA polymerase III epsilon subunit-like protein
VWLPERMGYVFVDCEATGLSPASGVLTEFGAVDFDSRETFHGVLWESEPDPSNPAKSRITGRQYDAVDVFRRFEQWLARLSHRQPVFVSDNPAYDFQWINHGFDVTLGRNPFGHSGRRISDFYAGLHRDFRRTQQWKRLRRTPHDHNPVHDAMGNVEAFAALLEAIEHADGGPLPV